MCICSFLVWQHACLNYREFDLEGDFVGVPHTWYLSAQSFITLLKLVWREYDIVAMNEWKKKCVSLHRTWVSKRTVLFQAFAPVHMKHEKQDCLSPQNKPATREKKKTCKTTLTNDGFGWVKEAALQIRCRGYRERKWSSHLDPFSCQNHVDSLDGLGIDIGTFKVSQKNWSQSSKCALNAKIAD